MKGAINGMAAIAFLPGYVQAASFSQISERISVG